MSDAEAPLDGFLDLLFEYYESGFGLEEPPWQFIRRDPADLLSTRGGPFTQGEERFEYIQGNMTLSRLSAGMLLLPMLENGSLPLMDAIRLFYAFTVFLCVFPEPDQSIEERAQQLELFAGQAVGAIDQFFEDKPEEVGPDHPLVGIWAHLHGSVVRAQWRLLQDRPRARATTIRVAREEKREGFKAVVVAECMAALETEPLTFLIWEAGGTADPPRIKPISELASELDQLLDRAAEQPAEALDCFEQILSAVNLADTPPEPSAVLQQSLILSTGGDVQHPAVGPVIAKVAAASFKAACVVSDRRAASDCPDDSQQLDRQGSLADQAIELGINLLDERMGFGAVLLSMIAKRSGEMPSTEEVTAEHDRLPQRQQGSGRDDEVGQEQRCAEAPARAKSSARVRRVDPHDPSPKPPHSGLSGEGSDSLGPCCVLILLVVVVFVAVARLS